MPLNQTSPKDKRVMGGIWDGWVSLVKRSNLRYGVQKVGGGLLVKRSFLW